MNVNSKIETMITKVQSPWYISVTSPLTGEEIDPGLMTTQFFCLAKTHELFGDGPISFDALHNRVEELVITGFFPGHNDENAWFSSGDITAHYIEGLGWLFGVILWSHAKAPEPELIDVIFDDEAITLPKKLTPEDAQDLVARLKALLQDRQMRLAETPQRYTPHVAQVSPHCEPESDQTVRVVPS